MSVLIPTNVARVLKAHCECYVCCNACPFYYSENSSCELDSPRGWDLEHLETAKCEFCAFGDLQIFPARNEPPKLMVLCKIKASLMQIGATCEHSRPRAELAVCTPCTPIFTDKEVLR